MKKMIAILACAAAGTVFAQPPTAERPDYETRMRGKAAFRAARERRTGGRIVKPGTGAGAFVFVNAAPYVGAFLDHAVQKFARDYKIDIRTVEGVAEVSPGNAARIVAGAGAAAGVVFTEDAQSPTTILLAPEQGWAIVNVAGLGADGAERAVVEGRAAKELVRAFAMVAGAAGSQFQKNIMSPVRRLEDLESFRNDMLPPDVDERISNTLPRIGIAPHIERTYREACEEGWAPEPTNEVQRAIWNKVHQMPANPMKIEFDPKKGR